MHAVTQGRVGRMLDAIGLDTPTARAWAMYDWANSAYATTVAAAVFPIYFVRVAGAGLPEGRAYTIWTLTNGLALAVSALMGPLLGAVADRLGMTRRFLFGFAALGIGTSALLALVGQGEWRLGAFLFSLSLIGFSSANVFYDALLTSVTTPDKSDRLSAAGYAMGYLGGGLLLVLNVLMLRFPQSFGLAAGSAAEALDAPATRWGFVAVAVWWFVFTLPLWRTVRSPEDDAVRAAGVQPGSIGDVVAGGLRQLAATLRTAPRHRDLFLFLVAFWLFSDGIGTFQKQAAAYGSEIGLSAIGIIGALVMTQFAGVPFSFAFGLLARRIGARRSLFIGLWAFTLISFLARFVTLSWHFYALAFGVAMVQGGTQALSRSLFASLVPHGKSAEFFAFFSVSSKFAGVLGPLLIGLISLSGVAARESIVVLVVLFLAGIAVLTRVDFARGRQAALDAAL
ncbi:MAG: MFS transporter [Ardenticatenales bacterium]|jgi:UMF1 family MFS transporter|nr:MFS transporter [Ardenticatenales bacterium]